MLREEVFFVAIQQPQPLPLPDNFPFQWDTPEEATQLLDGGPDALAERPLARWPRPWTCPRSSAASIKAAQDALHALRHERSTSSSINGYVYNSFDALLHDPEEMQQRFGADAGADEASTSPAFSTAGGPEYEPEVRSINDETLNGDYAKLGDRDLSALLETLVDKREREGELHFLAVFPAGGAVMFFEQVYTNLFGAPEADEHLQLLQGFPNKSVEAGDGLWHLAHGGAKRRAPVLAACCGSVEPSALHAALADSPTKAAPSGARWRSSSASTAGAATSLTSPSQPGRKTRRTVYKLIREYASRDDYDPEEEFRSLVAARQAREEVLLEQLAGSGQVEMFQQALAGAQQYLPIQEDHNFWIDQQGSRRAARAGAGGGEQADAKRTRLGEPPTTSSSSPTMSCRTRSGAARATSTELVAQRRREREEYREADAAGRASARRRRRSWRRTRCSASSSAGSPRRAPTRAIINGNAASAGQSHGHGARDPLAGRERAPAAPARSWSARRPCRPGRRCSASLLPL